MADIEVEGPDGAIVSFPQGTSSDVMQSALQNHYKDYAAKEFSSKEPGYFKPTFDKSAKTVQNFMGGDPTFAPNIGKGAMEIPGAVAGYVKSRAPTSTSEIIPKAKQIGSDIGSAAYALGKEFIDEPLSTIGSFIPGVSETIAVSDMDKLNKQINQLEAAGQKDKANELRKYLSLSAASIIPGATAVMKGGLKVAASDLTAEMRAAARAAGYSDADIEALKSQLLKNMNEKGTSQAAAREVMFNEFGIKPTLGQATGDPVQIARERASQNKKIADMRASQPEALQASAEEIVNPPSSYRPENIQGQAANDVISTLQSRAAKARGLSDAEYAKFYGSNGELSPEGLTNFGDRVKMGVDYELAPDPISHPNSTTALEIIKKETQKIANRGFQYGEMEGPTTAGDVKRGVITHTLPIGPTSSGMPLISEEAVRSTLQGMESIRKKLNKLYPQALKNDETAQFGAVIKSYDQSVEDLVKSAYFSGDPAAAEAAESARKMWGDYKKQFGIQEPGDKTGEFIEKLIGGAKNETDLQNAIFNLSSSGATTGDAIRLYDRLGETLGKTDPSVMQGISAGIKKDLLQFGRKGPDANYSDIATRIENNLEGSGRALVDRVLSKEEIGQLQRFSKVAKMLAEKGEQISADGLKSSLAKAGINLGSNIAALMFGDAGIANFLAANSASKFVGKGIDAISDWRQGRRAVSGLPYLQPPTAKPYYGAVRPFVEQAQQQPNNRSAHKLGGAVIDRAADNLIAETMRNQKMLANHTEQMLSMPDDAIVQALHVARSNAA
jgi:hypothetical protein